MHCEEIEHQGLENKVEELDELVREKGKIFFLKIHK